MKEKLPIYISRALVYVFIFVGLYKFYNEFLIIETIIIPETVIEQQSVPLVIKLIIGILIFIMSIGFSAQIFITYWDYIIKNKFSFVAMAPFMLLAIGTLNLIKSVMEYIQTLIEINSIQFIANLELYRKACDDLGRWLILALIVGLAGVAYNVVIKLVNNYQDQT